MINKKNALLAVAAATFAVSSQAQITLNFGNNSDPANGTDSFIDVTVSDLTTSPTVIGAGNASGAGTYTIALSGGLSSTPISGEIGINIDAVKSFDTGTFTINNNGTISTDITNDARGYGVFGNPSAFLMGQGEAMVLTFDFSGLTLGAGQQVVLESAGIFAVNMDAGTESAVFQTNGSENATYTILGAGTNDFYSTNIGSTLADGDQLALYKGEAGNGGPQLDFITFDLVTVPEPSTYALAAALLSLGVVAVRRCKA